MRNPLSPELLFALGTVGIGWRCFRTRISSRDDLRELRDNSDFCFEARKGLDGIALSMIPSGSLNCERPSIFSAGMLYNPGICMPLYSGLVRTLRSRR